MKAMKIALLGTAALAAASVGARADNLSDLKAQIETLNARVASLETAPSVPAGYSAVSFSKVGNEHLISIMPTADMPASTVITWSGWVRGAVVLQHDVVNGSYLTTSGGSSYWALFTSSSSGSVAITATTVSAGVISVVNTSVNASTGKYSTDAVDLRARAQLNVTGKTDTAVGEVGASISFRTKSADDTAYVANVGNGFLSSDGFSGWWKVTPNMTVQAGVGGSLSKNNYSWDGMTLNAYLASQIAGANNANGGDPVYFRVAYNDGPMGIAIQAEDSNNLTGLWGASSKSAFGVSAKATYAMDSVAFDVDGGWWGNANNTGGTGWGAAQDAYSVSAGVKFAAGPATFGAAVGTGQGFTVGTSFVNAAGIVQFKMGDATTFELGAGHTWNTSAGAGALDFTVVGGGIYYAPVSQLSMGVEGNFQSGGLADGSYLFDVFTKFAF